MNIFASYFRNILKFCRSLNIFKYNMRDIEENLAL